VSAGCSDCGGELFTWEGGLRCRECGREHEPPWYLDAADLLAEPDPGPTPWLVEDLIVDEALVAVVGKWKTTKSYGVLDVCVAITTGRPAFGGLAIPQPGPVVFVNEESGRAALWRRLDALCRGRAIDPEELRGKLLVAPNARVKLDDEEWQTRLLELGTHHRPRLFVFDPLARMKAPDRDESAQKDMAGALEFLRRLRDEAGAAVLIVHHTGHQGPHMRGTSDLETWWDTRLGWEREGESPEVTIKSKHREIESAPQFKYRIAWDGETRSMRFEAVEHPFVQFVRAYLADHPEASGNEVHKAAEGRDDRPHKGVVQKLVREVREGGSKVGNHPGTTLSGQRREGGSPGAPFRGPGTTPSDPPSQVVPNAGTTPVEDIPRCLVCGEAYAPDENHLERVRCPACVPVPAVVPDHGCERHSGARRWRARTGRVLCEECIPPLTEGAVVEWIAA
jgi:hypothetical protein